MSKTSHKMNSFLWALIIAVVSFFVIFLLFPDVSYKFFGVSVRQPVGKTVSEAAEKMVDKVSDTVTDAVSTAVTNAVTDVTEAVTEAVTESVSSFTNK